MLSTSHKLKNLAGKFLLLSLYYFWNPTSSFLHKTGNSQYEVKWITNCFWKTNQSYTHKTDKSNYQPQISINKIEKYIELNFPHPPKVIIFFKKDFFYFKKQISIWKWQGKNYVTGFTWKTIFLKFYGVRVSIGKPSKMINIDATWVCFLKILAHLGQISTQFHNPMTYSIDK